MSGDLAEFLRARYDEDEAAAQRAGNLEMWHGEPWQKRVWIERRGSDPVERIEFDFRNGITDMEAWWLEHAARHMPGRVLADIEGKRRIVERCAPLADMQVRRQTRTLAHDTLRALALPFADHPDYDERWKP